LVQPLGDINNILRVASELKVQTVVSGEIAAYRVDKTAAGKQAKVSIRTVCYDVASGLPVNGAAVSAASIVRSGDVSDDVLINDALSQAAASAIDQIGRQNLPVGVVQNVSLNKAYLNSGSQQGFKDGMKDGTTPDKPADGTAAPTLVATEKTDAKSTIDVEAKVKS
jgi:hypothetical protein